MELNSVLAYTFWADIIYMKKSLRGSCIASPAKALQQHANKCSTEWGGKSKYLFISHHPVSCQACGKRFHQAASPSWCLQATTTRCPDSTKSSVYVTGVVNGQIVQ